MKSRTRFDLHWILFIQSCAIITCQILHNIGYDHAMMKIEYRSELPKDTLYLTLLRELCDVYLSNLDNVDHNLITSHSISLSDAINSSLGKNNQCCMITKTSLSVACPEYSRLYMTLEELGSIQPFNTLRPRQNGCHLADNIFKCILMKMYEFH